MSGAAAIRQLGDVMVGVSPLLGARCGRIAAPGPRRLAGR